MLLYSGADLVGRVEVALETPDAWQPLQLIALVPEGGGRVVLKLVAHGSAGSSWRVQFDDISMRWVWIGANWPVPFYVPMLLNPSAEAPAMGLRPPLEGLVPQEVRQMVGVLLTPQQYNVAEIWGLYAREQYRSFWGNFGWLAIPLPEGLYLLLGIIAAVALAGLLVRGLRRLASWSALEWLGLVSLLALAVAVLVGFARQMMLLSLYGIPAFPQGRYLFVLIIPFVALFMVGLWEVFTLLVGSGRELYLPILRKLRTRPSQAQDPSFASSGPIVQGLRREPWHGLHPWQVWGAAGWVVGLLFFQLYSLLGQIIPYYRR